MKKGTKVYIISKSIGCSFDLVLENLLENHQTKTINYKGIEYMAIIGYICKTESPSISVITYTEEVAMREIASGDFYARNDFILSSEIHPEIKLEKELFEI